MITFEQCNNSIQSPYSIYTVDNLNWELHFHQAYECILVLSGEIHCHISEKIYTVSAHSGLFIMPFQPHSLITPSHSKILIIRFFPDLIHIFHTRHIHSYPQENIFAFHDFDYSSLQKETNIYMITSYLYQLCGLISKQTFFVAKTEWENPLTYKILEYVESHFTNSCHLTELSNALGYDSSYISKTFHKYTGLQYSHYVNFRRIQHACLLITTTDLPYIQISHMCGFDSLRSFNRNFLKYCNCTPSEYKKRFLQKK